MTMRPTGSATPRLDATLARTLFEDVRQAAQGSGAEIEATMAETASALTRFANNEIHQNVAEASLSLSVRTVRDQRMARASTNRLDAEGIAGVVERALRLTAAQAQDPEILPLPGPQSYRAVERHDAATAAVDARTRAETVRDMVAVAAEHQLTAAGVCATHESRFGIFNSAGLEAFYEETGSEYSVTMLGADSSGWAKASAPAWNQLDAAAGARRAAEKARASATPGEVAPGRYTVILEPAAVLDLLGFLFWDFGGQALLDQRSFLSDRMGQHLFGDNISIADDVRHPLQSGAPFDGEGMPRQSVRLVEEGWARQLVYARLSAARMARVHPEWNPQPTGHGFPLPNEYGEAPMNIVMTGGATSIDEMIGSTERGILVSRLWYIREVDPYQKIVTGMTRDGTFLIESGRLSRGLRNLRFNQSLIEMLNQVQALGPAVRAAGEESFEMVVPTLKVAGFQFTEVTRF